MYWEIELNPPHKVISVKTGCPEKKKLELLDKIAKILHSLGQTYHKVQIVVNKDEKKHY